VIARVFNFYLILALCGVLSVVRAAATHDRAINSNPRFEEKGSVSKAYAIEGDLVYGDFPDARSELAGRGVRFLSSADSSSVTWSWDPEVGAAAPRVWLTLTFPSVCMRG